MSNANYVKGRRSEYEHAAHLEDNGYTLVMRAAGSHGVADLIMAKPGETLLVQCKQAAADSPAKRGELRELARWMHAVPLLAGWVAGGPRGGRRPYYVDISRELAHRVWTPDHGTEAAS